MKSVCICSEDRTRIHASIGVSFLVSFLVSGFSFVCGGSWWFQCIKCVVNVADVFFVDVIFYNYSQTAVLATAECFDQLSDHEFVCKILIQFCYIICLHMHKSPYLNEFIILLSTLFIICYLY
jgi:hypothetical protein